MSMDIVISEAAEKDAAILSRLASDSFRGAYEGHPLVKSVKDNPIEAHIAEAFTERQILNELAEVRNHYYLVTLGDVPVGYAMLVEDEAPACIAGSLPIHLERIYFLKEHCGKGFGLVLLNYCMERARGLGKETVWLGVWDGNKRAIDFYVGHGFKKSGSTKFRVGSTGYEDTDLIFERSI